MSVPIPAWEANTAAAAPLAVFADVRFDTDGHRVHLVGDGQSLVLHSSDPRQLLTDLHRMSLPTTVSGTRGRTTIGRAGTALRDAGLRVDVRGPGGVLMQLGAGAGSGVGRWVTGSDAVTFGSVWDLSDALRVPTRTVAGLIAAAAVIAAVVLRRWPR